MLDFWLKIQNFEVFVLRNSQIDHVVPLQFFRGQAALRRAVLSLRRHRLPESSKPTQR